MVLGQIFYRFTGSATQTHCARRPQLVSKKFLEEEIFAGTNFRELAFDRAGKSRKFPATRYVAGGSNILSMADMVCLVAETVEFMSWVCTVCWSISYVVKCIAAEYGRYGLSCMQKLWSSWADLYGL